MSVTTACSFSSTGPAGTALTTSNTGSTTSIIGASATAVSTATGAVAPSSFAGLFTVPATNVSAGFRWSVLSGGLTCKFSVYFQWSATPSSTKTVFKVRNSTGPIWELDVGNTAGKLKMGDEVNPLTTTGTETYSLNTEYRAEILMTVGTTTSNGSWSVNIYPGSGTTPVNASAYTSTAANLGTTAITAFDSGVVANGTSVAWSAIISNLRYDTSGGVGSGEIGPIVTSVAPSANAGPDQSNVEPGTTVNLDGTGSAAVDPAIVTGWAWTQTAGTTSTLSNANANTPSYTAPATIAGTTQTWSLVVTDSNGLSSTADTVNITVLPVTERAVIGNAEVPMLPYAVSSS